jgi:ABC-type polysaccharide/polyol phosphate transport system ATPase subunit
MMRPIISIKWFEPEVLLLDEVMAVGDTFSRRSALGKNSEFG